MSGTICQNRLEKTMPIWVTVLIAFTTLTANIAIQFYFRFVPDVERQKDHLKSIWTGTKALASWLSNILWFGIGVWALYEASQHKGPVTPGLRVSGGFSDVLNVFRCSRDWNHAIFYR